MNCYSECQNLAWYVDARYRQYDKITQKFQHKHIFCAEEGVRYNMSCVACETGANEPSLNNQQGQHATDTYNFRKQCTASDFNIIFQTSLVLVYSPVVNLPWTVI